MADNTTLEHASTAWNDTGGEDELQQADRAASVSSGCG
jgi:hypothetical protein